MAECLIIDDNKLDLTMFTNILSLEGHDVTAFDQPQKALVHCYTNMPNVIYVDWRMPKLSGFDFIQMIRKLDNGADPYIILYSAREDDETSAAENEAREAGANGYVQNPISLEKIQNSLRGLPAHLSSLQEKKAG